MDEAVLRDLIGRVIAAGRPEVEIIRRAAGIGPRLGVFTSSFNPPTVAHLELIREAARGFSLDEMLALATAVNADKRKYECPLEDRLAMVLLAWEGEERVSVGLSSSAYFVDMADALERAYPGTTLHFVMGIDTLVRVLDRGERYTASYHVKFSDREVALEHLLTRSRLVVAGRSGKERASLDELLAAERPAFRRRVSYLDFPASLGALSATEVRERRRLGLPISELVPRVVERYIEDRGLYE